MLRFYSKALCPLFGCRFLHTAYYLNSPVNVKMPSLSPTMTEGSIVQWSKQEGDQVASGDMLCEVQTDKAVVALETDEEGVLAKIIVDANKPGIKVGDLIAIIASPGEDWKEVAAKSHVVDPSPKAPNEPVTTEAKPPQPTSSAPPAVASGPRSSAMGPAVRMLLQTHKLDASQIPATGPHGQLLKGDVLTFIASGGVQAAPKLSPGQPTQQPTAGVAPAPTISSGALFTDIPLTNMRQTIAKRLSYSKSSIPHTYVRGVASIDRVLALRKDLKSRIGLRLSVNDMIVKACALGLRMVPEMNSTCDEASNTRIRQTAVDISMAVATPSGLITPILRNADTTPISQLSQNAVALAKKAREGKLQPHEFQGGSFTISNLGMFDISEFTAVINPPQVAILAVGTGCPKAISVNTQNQVQFSNRVTLTLSIDSRFVNEAVAGRFLSRVCALLSEHPHMLLSDDPVASAALQTESTLQPDAFDVLMLSNPASPVSGAATAKAAK